MRLRMAHASIVLRDPTQAQAAHPRFRPGARQEVPCREEPDPGRELAD